VRRPDIASVALLLHTNAPDVKAPTVSSCRVPSRVACVVFLLRRPRTGADDRRERMRAGGAPRGERIGLLTIRELGECEVRGPGEAPGRARLQKQSRLRDDVDVPVGPTAEERPGVRTEEVLMEMFSRC
jgi:hypothetical protein